ncbi:ATP11-domain-containing protein [Gonapodya prolifera JEL478]|uniref:ATP11-domain-containing protein n=1 Tax=Gonapodya prolifera (strain JEL478) TaxID=1344416 RepID=A0A139A8Z9_GONPJ|nr:ATP11-domain-containing protein [Gonapodya prolifera JEL478]|eukprot:KXS13270.1 ATP11-domain-containing protein [Gonapodya prolifera JEL478]
MLPSRPGVIGNFSTLRSAASARAAAASSQGAASAATGVRPFASAVHDAIALVNTPSSPSPAPQPVTLDATSLLAGHPLPGAPPPVPQSSTTAVTQPQQVGASLNRDDPFVKKYEMKLQQKLRDQGFSSLDDYRTSVQQRRGYATTAGPPTPPSASSTATAASPDTPSQTSDSASSSPQKTEAWRKYQPDAVPPTIKSLDSILNLEKIAQLSADEIGELWKAYHARKDGMLYAVVPADVYSKLMTRGKEYPMFLLPVPREPSGFEFFLCQFQPPMIHFTTLASFQRQLRASPPAPAVSYFTLTHYPDLYHSHGVALMRGEVDRAACEQDGVQLTTEDARVLAWGVQQFYATGGRKKLRLVEKFHKDPQSFDYQHVVDEMDRME